MSGRRPSLPSDLASQLGFLRELGWTDLHRERIRPPEGAAEAAAKASVTEPAVGAGGRADARRASDPRRNDPGARAPQQGSQGPPPRRSEPPPGGPPEPVWPDAEPWKKRSGAGSGPAPAAGGRPSAPAGPVGPVLPEPFVVPDEPRERLRVLEEVAAVAATCRACRLAEGRKNVVFADGDPAADLMFVGEGPGAQEDRQGLPFVGPAGQLLTKIIEAIELRREQVYIANVVKCRPPNNRDPQPDEVAACRGFLERQIRLVQPRIIVCLGRVAAHLLLETSDSLSRLRGRWHLVEGVPTRVTYHPAALLRAPTYKRPTWEDMQVVRDRLRGGE